MEPTSSGNSPAARESVKGMVAGAVAGGFEPLSGQPLWTITRRLQERQPNPFRPKGVYSGVYAAIGSFVPTTAIQWGVKGAIGSDSILACFASGWIGGVTVGAMTEQTITVYQHARELNPKAGFVSSNRLFLSKHGISRLASGALATGMRDGKFTIGMFYLLEQSKGRISVICDRKDMPGPLKAWLPDVLAGLIAGPCAAWVSHPWATIAQKQRGRGQRMSMVAVLREIKTENQGNLAVGLWRGAVPRVLRAAVALVTIPIIAKKILNGMD